MNFSAGFNLPFLVPEGDLDASYRHISHWVSLRYLEHCRVEFLSACGCPVEKLIAIDAFPVVTSIEVRYLREIFKEEVILVCRSIFWQGRACKLNQAIIKQNGKAAVEALVELKFLSQLKKRSIEPPQLFVTAMQECQIPTSFDTAKSEV